MSHIWNGIETHQLRRSHTFQKCHTSQGMYMRFDWFSCGQNNSPQKQKTINPKYELFPKRNNRG